MVLRNYWHIPGFLARSHSHSLPTLKSGLVALTLSLGVFLATFTWLSMTLSVTKDLDSTISTVWLGFRVSMLSWTVAILELELLPHLTWTPPPTDMPAIIGFDRWEYLSFFTLGTCIMGNSWTQICFSRESWEKVRLPLRVDISKFPPRPSKPDLPVTQVAASDVDRCAL